LTLSPFFIPHSVENCAFLEGGKRNSQSWVFYPIPKPARIESAAALAIRQFNQVDGSVGGDCFHGLAFPEEFHHLVVGGIGRK
jgi:hypothetical protein